MAKLLEEAIAKLRKLPSDRQDEAGKLILSMVGRDPETMHLSSEQVAEVDHSLREPSRYATHAEVRAFFEKQPV